MPWHTAPMSEAPHTLAHPADHEVTIRKSRFLVRAAPVTDEGGAMSFLEQVAQADANHNCWAWRVGQRYRFSDDGEPGGSAGKPILRAIEGQNLDRVMVVVTRWFGGIKLGVGGLMRAYGGSAAECLRQAPTVPIVEMRTVRFGIAYPELERLRARIQDWTTETLNEDYGAEHVQITLQLPADRIAEFEQLLSDLSRGQSSLQAVGKLP